jgi:ankyrin repeat protein
MKTEVMFVSQAQKLDERALDIFEALDLDSGETAEYFKQKCSEVPSDILVTLRDKRIGNEGRTLLHNAARCGSLAAALFLIRLGHAVEPTDSGLSKITPLMDAIMNQHVEIAIVLVESGASIFFQDVNGENALHYAARSGSSRMVKWLIKAAGLNREQIQELTATTNIRLKFPEDLAANTMTKDVLVNFRRLGAHGSLFRKQSKRKSY